MSKRGSSKRTPDRRPPPTAGAGGKGVAPDVRAAYREAVTNGRVASLPRKAYKVELPIVLGTEIKQEATRLTGHGRRGWSDLLTILVDYAWREYKAGNVQVGTEEVIVEKKIVVVEEPR